MKQLKKLSGSRSLTSDFAIRFLIIIILISTLVFTLTGLVFLRIEAGKFDREVHRHFEEFKQLIAAPLWHYDEVEIATIGRTFLSGGMAAKIVILSEENEQLYAFGNTSPNDIDDRVLSGQLLYDSKYIGNVEFHPRRPKFLKQNKFFLSTITSAIVLICISIAAATWRLLKTHVKQPLGELLDWINKVESGVYDSTQMYFPQREIQSVVSHFSLMVESIKNREQQIKASEQRLMRTFDNAPVGAAVVSLEGGFLQVNAEFCRITGYAEEALCTMSIVDVVHPDDVEKVKKAVTRFADEEIEHYQAIQRLVRKNGDFVWGRVSVRAVSGEDGKPLYLLPMVEDIHEQKVAEEEKAKLQDQLMQAQKMEAIGTLAGGIAHDFNNILSAIIGYAELSKIHRPQDDQLTRYLDNVMRAGGRAKDLVQQILTFSRQTEQELKPVPVRPIVEEALKLLRASLPSTIDIKQDVSSESLVMGNPTQLHQILMNLCTNSGHAMKENGGTLEVVLKDAALDAAFASRMPDLSPGPYLHLIVSDTGHGIPSEILDRIFDPFFTTKDREEGTGMGLAVVHGIVTGYGGSIIAHSTLGKGTTFEVFLPAVDSTAEGDQDIQEVLPGGTERILFIDDEPDIVDIGKKMLEGLGYQVVTTTRSIEALELFQAQAERFDLVISDMTMPEMTGDKLAGKIISTRKDIPVVICTGFSYGITEQKAREIGVKGLLMKPIVRSELASVVRKVLDENRASVQV